MYEEYYAPLPDRGAYLRRIGYNGTPETDVKSLDRLVRAHLTSVPFENLDVYDAQTEILLDTASLFDKLVTRRRGGYCFELNGLFYTLLRELGFDCYPIAVRVVWMSDNRSDRRAPLSHRAAVVNVGGERYFCDVGFGGPAPHRALKLDDTSAQESDGQRFVFTRMDGDTVLSRLTDAGREPLLRFSELPYDVVDFLALSEYQSRNKNSGFKKVRLVNIAAETGSASVTGDILCVRRDGAVTETVLDTEEALRTALKQYFGLDIGFPLKV